MKWGVAAIGNSMNIRSEQLLSSGTRRMCQSEEEVEEEGKEEFIQVVN